MSYKEFKEIKIHEFRLIKTLEPMGLRGYFLMTKYSGTYKSPDEQTTMMWSSSLIHEMNANKDTVSFNEWFITNLAELKNILRNAVKNVEIQGISLTFVHHDKADKPEVKIAGRFITTMAERIYENSLTAEAYAVLGHNLYAEYVQNKTEKRVALVIQSEKPYVWDRIDGDSKILSLYFDHVGPETFEMLNADHLSKVRKIKTKKGYVIEIKKWPRYYYVSGVQNRKGLYINFLLLHPDIDMAVGFANEDEALETMLSLGEKLKCENFEVKYRPSQFFSIYENPPSVMRI